MALAHNIEGIPQYVASIPMVELKVITILAFNNSLYELISLSAGIK
jgi:hypothetical protein